MNQLADLADLRKLGYFSARPALVDSRSALISKLHWISFARLVWREMKNNTSTSTLVVGGSSADQVTLLKDSTTSWHHRAYIYSYFLLVMFILALLTEAIDPYLGVFEFRYPLKPKKTHE